VRQRPLVHRYLPFLAIVALLGVLMILEPDPGSGGAETVGMNGGAGLSSGGGGGAAGGTGTGPVGGGTSDASADGPAAGGPDAGTGTGGETGAGPGAASGGGDVAAETASASGQRVDGLGRPLEGDRARCAPGGELQTDVVSYSLPCQPALIGDNGGATHRGVTAEEITVVIVVQHFEPATQQALLAVGLAATDQEYQEASTVYAEHINKRYELYGRKIKPIIHAVDCITGDNACQRAEAKAVAARHKPFAALWFIPGIAPVAWADEMSRLGIVNTGAPGIETEWFVQRRPYAWTELPQSPKNTDSVSDYYCKKMWGKNADHAGDPVLRTQRRKLGIVATEEPNVIAAAKRVQHNVSGGMCGSPSDGTQFYTISANSSQANEQRPTLIARMKNDGITTTLWLPSMDTLGCRDCDRQQFFPEHLIGGQNQNDADIVGRLDTTGQRSNRFGIGFRPAPSPLNQHDFRRAARDVRPGYEPPYITEGPYLALAMFGKMVQLAGPNLTPPTIERGAQTSPQLGGWENPNPWPGWKCCDPFVPKFHLGAGDTNFSAQSDAREVYWSDTAISPDDGQPGAWVCVDNCRRYDPREWPKGEPKQ
jgi:hypothetical protein